MKKQPIKKTKKTSDTKGTHHIELGADSCAVLIGPSNFGVIYNNFEKNIPSERDALPFNEKLTFALEHFLKDPVFISAMITYYEKKRDEKDSKIEFNEVCDITSDTPFSKILKKKTASIKDLEVLVESVFKN